ncbi:MAG: NAD(P)H-hydrate dehydratase [Alphaproteobacteria bacterium]|nr:NAD(P)H-hydrate dehydratase [Alphaproteobacteria bacterium]
MRAIDTRSAELGTPTRTLMEAAGRAVADAIAARYAPQPVLILCGPGGNGGDGFVVARLLAAQGWPVRVALQGEAARLTGDAADAAGACPVAIEPLDAALPVETMLVVDALYGAGLSRPLDALCADLARRARRVVSVDVPSGVHGDGAAPVGETFRADLTVTFVRKKPAHVLEPGRTCCGEIVLADIGAPAQAVDEAGVTAFENHPSLWALPWPDAAAHKHARGRVAIVAGAVGMSVTDGAVRLAARAAQRAGAGWVSVYTAPEKAALYAHEPAALVVRDAAQLSAAAGYNAIVFGPGAGRAPRTAAQAIALAQSAARLVLDADALSSAADDPDPLFLALRRPGAPPHAVLTPHAGEFARLFPDAASGSKLERTRAAAARSGAVVLFKGADTVIAAPDGRAIVNTHATPWLASAGTGDVLAGIIAALLAQGLPAFDAAAAAAWLHGDAGLRCGPGLIADDLPAVLPAVLDALAPAALRAKM